MPSRSRNRPVSISNRLPRPQPLALNLGPSSGLCLCHPRPSSSQLTTTAIAAVNDHHQFFRTVDNNDQNPLDVVSHRGRRWQSSSSAAAVDGCGSDGIFAAAVNYTTWNRTVSSIPLPPPSMTTIVDDDHHCRRCYRPPPQPTMAAIAVVNDDDRSRRLHPTITSIDDDRRQQRPACQRTLGQHHQCRARPPSDSSHRRLSRR